MRSTHWMLSTGLTASVLLILALAVGGCNMLGGPTFCTQIGCDDGVNVVLSGATTGPFQVSVEVDGEIAGVVDCPPGATCSSLFVPGIRAEHVTVIVTRGEDVRRFDVSPTYVTVQPNGPNCEPICRQGQLHIQL
ncbi:hypothetical protein BH23BAC4_BH23BAC4_03950 [soil metagenome]